MHCSKLCSGNTSYKYCWKQYEVWCRYLSNLNSDWIVVLSRYFCEIGLCVVLSIQCGHFEVTLWIVRTIEFWIKWYSVAVNVLLSLFYLMMFFSSDGMAFTSCIHWKYKLFCVLYPCLRVFKSLKEPFLSASLLIWINILDHKAWFSMQERADGFTLKKVFQLRNIVL